MNTESNLAIREKLREYSRKPYQKKDGSLESVFLDVDLPALNSLPAKDYEIAVWKVATVSFNYHIEAERMYCSVSNKKGAMFFDV
jgi:hypothetical protein